MKNRRKYQTSSLSLLNISRKKPVYAPEEFTIRSPTGMIKKVVQQGRSIACCVPQGEIA
jgi:hypothetical protein